MVLIPLISIPLSFIVFFLKKHQIIFGLFIALIICAVDLTLKTTKNITTDFEGYGVSNLIVLVSYVGSGLTIITSIVIKQKYFILCIFLILYFFIAYCDFCFIGMYKATHHSKSTISVEKSINNGLLNHRYSTNDNSIKFGNDTIEIIDIWTENLRIIKNGLGNNKDTLYIKDYYINFSIKNNNSSFYKIYWTFNGQTHETYGREKNDEKEFETYAIVNKQDLTKLDSMVFTIGKDSEFIELIAIRNK
jgi:hypothetical protein